MAVEDGAAGSPRAGKFVTLVSWAVICLLAAAFIARYVFPYYLNFSPEGFHVVYWPRRWGLLAHITTGMTALALGPIQFWTGLRGLAPTVHRWTGRLYLVAVAVGSAAGLYLAITTTGGWDYGLGLGSLAVAWAGCALVAYLAIRQRAISLHRRWMIRTYVVTFAFVIYRLLDEWLPTSQLKPDHDRSVAIAWSCWAIPLLITVLVQGLQDVGRRVRA